jgi:hypothetical protein
MDQVREESTIIDEEARNMVSDKIMISALAVYLRSETMCVSSRVCSAYSCHNDRETSEDVARGVSLQPACRCKVAPISGGGEGACQASIVKFAQSLGDKNHKLRVPKHALLSQEHVRGQSVSSSS